MVSIVTKKIKGIEYLYLVESLRKDKKIIQKTIKYIGKKRPIPKEEFESMNLSYKNEAWILKEFKDLLSYQNHEEMEKLSEYQFEHIKGLDDVFHHFLWKQDPTI